MYWSSSTLQNNVTMKIKPLPWIAGSVVNFTYWSSVVHLASKWQYCKGQNPCYSFLMMHVNFNIFACISLFFFLWYCSFSLNLLSFICKLLPIHNDHIINTYPISGFPLMGQNSREYGTNPDIILWLIWLKPEMFACTTFHVLTQPHKLHYSKAIGPCFFLR